MHTRTRPLALAALVLGFLAVANIGLPLLVQLTTGPVALAAAFVVAVALTVVYVRMGRRA